MRRRRKARRSCRYSCQAEPGASEMLGQPPAPPRAPTRDHEVAAVRHQPPELLGHGPGQRLVAREEGHDHRLGVFAQEAENEFLEGLLQCRHRGVRVRWSMP